MYFIAILLVFWEVLHARLCKLEHASILPHRCTHRGHVTTHRLKCNLNRKTVALEHCKCKRWVCPEVGGNFHGHEGIAPNCCQEGLPEFERAALIANGCQ